MNDAALLASAGAALVLTQYLAAREIGSTFFSTEIVLLLATVIMLAGPSVGYAVAHRVSDRALLAWGLAALAIQLAMPTAVRACVGHGAAHGLLVVVFTLVLVVVGLAVSSFYAIFLPRRAIVPTSLPRLYAIELAGGVLAVLVIAVAPAHRWVVSAHALSAMLVLAIAVDRVAVTMSSGLAALLVALLYPRLDRAAANVYYARYQGLPSPVVLQTEYSPYQRVDVVDDSSGSRSLFLDGVYFFRSRAFEAFNVFLAEVPGSLRDTRGDALVVGSGSFLSAGLLHRLGYSVTVVELDEAVARLGFFHFADVHGLSPGEVRVEIADARRYLAHTAQSFDVIVLDVPAPYHVQTALLHSEPFYRMVSAHLRPGGVAAISLCGEAGSPIARSIIAGAARAFSSVAAIEPSGAPGGFLYAGNPLPFTSVRLARDLGGGRVLDDREVRALAGKPIDATSLAATMVLAREPLREMLHGK
jgi:spermidine synthase